MTTDQRPVRFGYVGCGFMAQKVHLPNFSRIPGCELLALAEVRAGLRDRVADRYGIPRRDKSHEEMARDRRSRPSASRRATRCRGRWRGFAARRQACRHGEADGGERAAAEEFFAASREGGGRLMVAYRMRYDAGNEAAKAALDRSARAVKAGAVTYARNTAFVATGFRI